MLYSIKRLIVILTALALLSGCWGRTEVDSIAIVNAIGVDLIEHDSLRLTMLLAVPRLIGTSSASGGGGDAKLETTAGWVVSEEARTVTDAFTKLQEKLPRKIFFSHNRILIVSEALAKNGVLPILDFFLRNRQSQINSYLIVSKTDTADVIRFKPKFEKLASEVMKKELQMNDRDSAHLGSFYNMIMEEGQEAYAPQILFVPSERGNSGLENLAVSKGTAVFKEDKLVGWLNDTETLALQWIRNEMQEGVVTVRIPKENGGGYVSGKLENVKSRITPVVRNGTLKKVAIMLSASLKVTENTSKLDLNAVGNKTMVGRLFAYKVKERVEMLCTKVQRTLRSDVLGFGRTMFKDDTQLWSAQYAKEWDSVFPDIHVDISARVQIVQTGLIGKDRVRGK